MTPRGERESALLRLGLVFATTVLIVGGAAMGGRWLAGRVDRFSATTTVPPGRPVEVVVPAGSSSQQISQILASAGVVASASNFDRAAREADAAESLKAGTYQLTTGMNPDDVVVILVAGPVVETYWITIPEGLRVAEILERIAAQSAFTVDELERALLSGRVESAIRPRTAVQDLFSWEGLLFPDTYQMRRDWSAADVLGVLAATMEERYSESPWNRGPAAALTAHERVIAASIIESETRLDRDRPLVAAVIFNRLDAGMPLQMDATVLYAVGVRGRAPTAAELETDSPYNTYVYPGLPPTPISAPGAASLNAVADPAEGDYLYYVLTGADGSHSFTADYEEFLRWKEESRERGLS